MGSLLGREPVATLKGLVSALLVVLVAVGVPVDGGAEAALQGGLVAVMGLVAAFRVRRPDRPTVVVGGLISGLAVGLAAYGVHVSEPTVATVQAGLALLVALVTRDRVTPEVGPGVSP